MRAETTAAGAAAHDFAEGARVLWNDVLFETILPVRRKSSVVRTRQVPPAQMREYARCGWPKELILLYEHRLKLVGDLMTLVLFSNAPEAEFELPDRIVTPVRDLSSFREARLAWRGREELAFVSARLTSPRQRLKAANPARDAEAGNPARRAAPPVAFPPAILRAIEGVLKGGVLVRNAALPDRLTPDERMVVNLAIAAHPDKPDRPLSLTQIGWVLGVFRESIRRRLAESSGGIRR